MAVVVDKEKCGGCATCVDACPVEAISMKDDLAVIDEDACIECEACISECPCDAIALP
jgi:Fe-S-cluster-containing hydrogenase component 2